ncbi:DUF2288 family protein [Haloferula sp. A504]|uniref:DUF2288 family protein n=1 Tax=Haloferula sp. A504 TaxID=3373601 RepID=UPI0031BD9F65|nr:DUF2288 domain-containing protein [Verrucomicrobiaceae bacterium E54]
MSERDEMKYAILGEDGRTEEQRIADYTGEVGWEYLKPHYERGCLLWVDASLDLQRAAMAFVEDDSEQVANWLGSGELVKIGALHAAQWEGGDERFTAVVVSPFVLMKAC